ncbi:hypothetical protein ISN44_As12g038860 [Arabidopsis suecica]|uniref:Uncharacterized protein n=1 Tax=Arabidopsis suecica TaxID=45249 RepID=A0A8T1YRW6_ARASU|nr:hypothetical protein ISN44_As12g038860 [Arabidopsis suecica]
MSPMPINRWPFRRGEGNRTMVSSPHTPKAPKHAPRPRSTLSNQTRRDEANHCCSFPRPDTVSFMMHCSFCSLKADFVQTNGSKAPSSALL